MSPTEDETGVRRSGAAAEAVEAITALMVRSVEFANAQRWDEALACLDRAVADYPWLPLARINRARLLAELRRYEAALDDCDFFLRYVARLAPIEDLRQQILDDALRDLGDKLAQAPGDVEALFARGNLYLKSRLYAPALADYAALLERDAAHVDALNNRGAALYALGRYGAALAAYRAAVCLAPQRARLWFNLGNVWQALGRLEHARATYRQAIALSPQLAEAHLEAAHCALAAGDCARGWRDFEWRWRTAQMRNWRVPSQAPLWLGGERPPAVAAQTLAAPALTGKTLLVWAEQGAGDTLQFVRFVARLVPLTEPGGRVVLRVPAALRRLLARIDGRVEVIGDDVEPPPHHAHCPLMSLPLALGVADDVAAPPYLRADAAAVALWRERLGARAAPRVGLVWAGRQFGQTNLTRDIALAHLAPLAAFAALDIDWVSLQKEVPPADAPQLAAWPRLRDFSATLGDYADTAALIMNLDLTIAVDTSVAHLAGALGKPCWLLLRYSGEWRWQRERTDSPWYPTLRLFRQTTPGDWDELVARVAAALAAQFDAARQHTLVRPANGTRPAALAEPPSAPGAVRVERPPAPAQSLKR